jgi:hypothetical protein
VTRCPATTLDRGELTACRLPRGHRGHHDDGVITWPNGWRARVAWRIERYRAWWRGRP